MPSYECSNGHEIESERPLSGCPARRRGQPCEGTLHAFGEGAQQENRRLKATATPGSGRVRADDDEETARCR